MALLALKVSAAVSIAGTVQPGTVQVRSALVKNSSTVGLVLSNIGNQGPPGVGANWRGLWSSGTTYALNDGVTGSDGHNYVSLAAGNLNHNPTSTSGFWSDLLYPSVITDASLHGTADWAVVKEAPLNVEYAAYGASPGNTGAANVTAINGAIAACPPGGAILLPRNYPINAAITINQQITILGTGIASGLTLANGAGSDGLVIASVGGGQVLTGVILRDFAIVGGASSCRNALVLRDLFAPIVEGVYIKAGAVSYAASIAGVLDGHLELFTGSNLSLPGTTSAPANGVNIISSASFPSNANRLRLYVGGIAGVGVFSDGSTGTTGSFDNTFEGTIEGCTGLGLRIVSAQGWHVRDMHIEGVGTGNGVSIESSPNGTIGPAVFAGNSGGTHSTSLLSSSTNVVIEGSILALLAPDGTSLARVGHGVTLTAGAPNGPFVNTLRGPTVSQPARSLGTAYQPSTSRDVMVVAVVQVTGGGAGGQIVAYCDGANPPTVQRGQFELPASNGNGTITFICPAGSFYQFTQAAGTVVLNIVTEYAL